MKENFSGKSFESQEQNEKYSSKIKLHVFRHGEKEDADKPDEKIHLTEQGRKDTVANSDADSVGQSVAYGSPRERSQQTAGLEMTGGREEVTGEESFEELMEKLNNDIEIGSKVGIDDRLNFSADKGTGFAKWVKWEYENDNLLRSFIKSSEFAAHILREGGVHTYSRYAENVAKLLDRYVHASDRWGELVQDNEKDYDKELERFLGTHALVGESFLAKVIERTAGVEERDKFIDAVGSQGFGFNEGYDIKIVNRDGEKQIRISYESESEEGNGYEFDKAISPDVIANIASRE